MSPVDKFRKDDENEEIQKLSSLKHIYDENCEVCHMHVHKHIQRDYYIGEENA